jgi:RNA polymerase sigma-70 factor (ECF subfamily)
MLGLVQYDSIASFAAAAAKEWPAIRMPAGDFVEYVRSKLGAGGTDVSLEQLRGPELYLVFGCLHGDREAWRAFDRNYLAKVPEYVARVDRSPVFADEVRQRVAEKLAIAADGSSKLAQYSGRGALGAWLRVASLREAHTMVRGQKHAVDADEVPLCATAVDPELSLLKRRSASLFRRAFAEVLAKLSDDERTLLKLHYIDGLTIEDVGRASRVSRASAARLLAQTRERVVERVEEALKAELGMNAPGAKSLLDLVRSDLDMSIIQHFTPQPDEKV